jgi:hypothetical protein
MKISYLCFLILSVILSFSSCRKENNIVQLYYNETYCGDPWGSNRSDANYTNEVKDYLQNQGINIKEIAIFENGPLSGCFSCFCTTGRRIAIKIYESDKNRALQIGFFTL